MKLIIGLGNPEPQYDTTRHNIGFRCLDSYAKSRDLTWKRSDKFRAYLAEFSEADEKVLLVKPTTFYNLVGESAHALADFYKIPPEDILIVHDELALPFSVIRTREKGSDAGNNGIKSLNAHLDPTTKRLRIGIRNDLTERMDAADFVLSKFTLEETKALPEIIKKSHQVMDGFLSNTFATTTV